MNKRERVGDLDGIKEFDNDLKKIDDIMDYYDRVLYGNEGVLNEYVSNHIEKGYNASPKGNEGLSNEDVVCRELDLIGTRILSANDIESNRSIEYKFWKNDREYSNYKESENINSIASTEGGSDVDMIDIVSMESHLDNEGGEEILDWSYVIDYEDKSQVKILLESISERSKIKGSIEKEIWKLHKLINTEIKLSDRERDIVDLLDKKYKQADIADELNISRKTVWTIISRIADKIIKKKGEQINDVQGCQD